MTRPEYPLIEWGGGCNLCGHEPWNEGDDHDPGCEVGQILAENARLRELAVPMCDVEGCGEDATLGFVMNPGDGLRYGISVCEEHFDNGITRLTSN